MLLGSVSTLFVRLWSSDDVEPSTGKPVDLGAFVLLSSCSVTSCVVLKQADSRIVL